MRLGLSVLTTLGLLGAGLGVVPASASVDPPSVTITAVAPQVLASGTTFQVTGTGFSTSPAGNTVTVNGRAASVSAASAESLTVALPSSATSGPVVVTNAAGSATSPVDVYVPPAPFVPADVESTGRASDVGVTATVSSANKISLLTFAGVKDERAALQLSDGTFGSSSSTARITVLRPSGSSLISSTGFGNAGLWLDSRVLPETGTYTVLIDPQATATGQVKVRAFNVPMDAEASAVAGGLPVVSATTVPGQNARVNVVASADQRLAVTVKDSTFGTSSSNASVSVLKPDGTTLVSARGFATAGTFLDTFKAPVGGTYRVIVDPQGAATGQASVQVHDVGEDPVNDESMDGEQSTIETAVPGQNARVRFPASANQTLSVQLTNSTFGSSSASAAASVLKPDGTVLVSPRNFGTAGTFIDAVVLPTAGTYTLLVDPSNALVGAVDVRLNDAAPVQRNLPPGDGAVVVATSAAGQNAHLSFAGSAGSRFSVRLTDSTFGSSTGSAQVSVRKPDGTTLVAAKGFGTAGTFLETFSLPADGTYSVHVDPQGTATGQVSVQLFAVPTNVVVTGAADGNSRDVTIETPGQNGAVTFPTTAEERLSFLLRGSTFGTSTTSASVSVAKPDGSNLVASRGLGSADVFIDTIAATSTGNHQVVVDPASAATGKVQVQVFSVPAPDRGSLTAGGPPRTIATSVPGEDAFVTIPAAASQRTSITLTASTFSNASVSVLAPDGSSLVPAKNFSTSGATIDFLSQVAGDHRLVINPSTTTTGTVTVTAFDAAEHHATVEPGGDEVTVATTNPGQNAAVTFDGTQGQRVSVQLRDSTYGSSSSSASVSLRAPDGTTLVAATSFGSAGVFIDTKTLPADGTYRLVIDPQGTAVGQVAVRVHDVPADPAVSVVPGGAPGTIATVVPGQNGAVTFDAVKDQRVSLQLTDVTFGTGFNAARVSLLAPDGTAVVAPTGFSNSGTFVDTKTLPATGTYTIVVDPQGSAVGQAGVSLFDVPADASLEVTAGGDAVTVVTSVPGQNGTVTLAGEAGQRVSVELTDATFGTGFNSARVSLLRPDGSAMVGATSFSNAGTFLDVRTLPVTGVYTVLVDPQAAATGQVRVKVNDVPADLMVPTSPGAPGVTVATTAPGQNALITFDGGADKAVSIQLTGTTFGTGFNSARVSLLRPDGTVLIAPTSFNNPGVFLDKRTLPTAGTYQLLIDPQGSAVGRATVAVHAVPPDSESTIEPGGSFVVVATDTPGQNARLTSTLNAGVTYRLRVDRSAHDATVRVTGPNGEVVDAGERASEPNDIVTFSPSATGAHTLTFDPEQAGFGTWRLELYTKIGTPRITGDADNAAWIDDTDVYTSWATDATGTIAGYAVLLDNQPDTEPGTTLSQTTNWTVPSDLEDGEHWLHVRAQLTSGDWSRTGHYRIGIDTTGPGVLDFTSPTHPTRGSAGPAEAQVSWRAEDAGAGVEGYSFTIQQDSGQEPDDTVDLLAPEWDDTLTEGTWMLSVRAVDRLGHWGATETYGFFVDETAPSAPALQSGTHPVEGSASRTFVGSWHATDEVDTVSVWAASVSQDPDETPDALTHSTTLRRTLAPGRWYLHVRGKDASGQWSPVSHRQIDVLDSAAGLTSPVDGQLLWAEEPVRLQCEEGAQFTVHAIRGQTEVPLGVVSSGPTGECGLDWQTDATQDGTRVFEAGEYTVEIRDADGAVQDAVRVTVAVDPSLAEVLRNRYLIGVLDAGTVTEYVYGAILDPESLPEPYRGLALAQGVTEDVKELLAEVSASLSPSDQAGLLALENPQPVTAAKASRLTRSGGQLLAATGTDECEVPNEVAFGSVRRGWGCVWESPHFVLLYDVEDNSYSGGTSMIERHATALESAFSTYRGLGFEMPTKRIPVYYSSRLNDGAITPGNFILMDSREGNVGQFLPQHELFHVVQWQYMNPRVLSQVVQRDTGNIWWFNEASANWASWHADNNYPAADGGYTQELEKYLARTDKQFDQGTDVELGAEYGAFPFPIFMERELGVQSVENVLAFVGNTATGSPTDSIVAQFGAGGMSFADMIERFRWSTYVLDEQLGYGFPTADVVSDWRPHLVDHGNTAARVPVASHFIEPNETIQGRAEVESSGSSFIELTKLDGNSTGEVTFTVTTEDGAIRAGATSTKLEPADGGGTRSAICEAPRRVTLNNGVGTIVVDLPEECPTAVLHIVSTDRPGRLGPGSDSATWSATFSTTTTSVFGGNIQLGLNSHGGVIGGDVGLRRVGDPDSEMLAHGCSCEGWGIGNNTAHGAVSGLGSSLELVEFTSDGVSATSKTKVSGEDESIWVTHRFSPSAHPDLYKVEVTATAMTPRGAKDVKYRRAFDWDVNPNPFDEYTTWARGSGGDVSYITYLSNDGFANPDPTAPPTHLGAVGYYEDAGPMDQGGLIEIALGDLNFLEARTFTFYYGVTTSEAGAISAVSAVGADAYSLGQPNVAGGADTGTPFTAVFAIDSQSFPTSPFSLAGSEEFAPKGSSAPLKRHKMVRGVRGQVQQKAGR